MSSISSVSGSSYIRQSQGTQGRHGNPAQRLEKDLTAFLNDQGVSAEDQKSILSEIKEGLSSAASSGGRPDPSKFQEIVQKVLDDHGLKGSDFIDSLPTPPTRPSGENSGIGGSGRPSGPPPGPPPSEGVGSSSGTSSTSSTAETEEETFLEKLLALLKSQAKSSSSKTSTSIAETYTSESIDLLA
jgi:hypothetical protein